MPQKQIKKAMILSAGLGTRLLPATQLTPKPLLPVLNIPNIVHTLYWLTQNGVEEVVFNIFHLAEKLESFLNSFNRWGLKISLSREDILLGTGGGVKKAEWFFGREPFFLVNCDFICDFDLEPLVEMHFDRKALASMVLWKNEAQQNLYSKVGINARQELVQLPKKKTQVAVETGLFTGIHILHPILLRFLEEKPCGINEILYPRLMQEAPHQTLGLFTKGLWLDTGDKPAYLETNLFLLNQMPPLTRNLLKEFGYQNVNGIWSYAGKFHSDQNLRAPLLIGQNLNLPEKTVLTNSVVGDHVTFTNNILVENSVLLNHTHATQSCTRSLLWEKGFL